MKGSFLGTSAIGSNYQVDICPGNICPGDICPYQEYLSCYSPDFDKTLKAKAKSILGISQLLVTQFCSNFKGRFLGYSLTDANCHDAICSGNVCPANICPYQHNVSCYWPDFDQTFGTKLFGVLINVDHHFFKENFFCTQIVF